MKKVYLKKIKTNLLPEWNHMVGHLHIKPHNRSDYDHLYV